MSILQLSFESGECSLSVRRFEVREALSALFEISVWARSPDEDLDLASLVGRPASLRIGNGVAHVSGGSRSWSGVCSYLALEHVEPTGLSTYHLRIVPALWLLTQRRNHRVFQHRSAPEIVEDLLHGWAIEPTFQLDRTRHPRLEYRVQHGESDFAFLSRTCEEAGISYRFSTDEVGGSAPIFTDAPHAGEPRGSGPIRYVDNPNQSAEQEFITQVRIAHEVRPGKVALRDHDFRRRTDYKMATEVTASGAGERLEQFHYEHGSFVVEGHAGGDTPVADDRGVARADEGAGRALATSWCAGDRASARVLAFQTNVFDLHPGRVFSIGHHPRADLAPDKQLLVTELMIAGTHDEEWSAKGRAVFAANPYYPPRATLKPRVHGVESAVVVGPAGQEIHTDEFGRVRVQFHWDRLGALDERSSCWIRVSQGAAGGGFGMLSLPRVGQEVLVGFFGGDPDQPVVVGRVFNNTARVPYKLPEHRTRSTWKSNSSPGSDGFNEIMFEDARGHERVFVQAERNLDKLVKHDETITVGKNRATTVGEVDEAAIGVKEVSHIKGTPTGREMVAGRISFTTGEATITLEGPNITMQAAANIMLNAGASILANAGAEITIHGAANITVASGGTANVRAAGGDLVLQGGPIISMNPGAGGGTETEPRTLAFGDVHVVVPPDVNVDENLAIATKHRYGHPRYFMDNVGEGGPWDYTKLGPTHRAFHLFHLGMVGRAMGLPRGTLIHYAQRHCVPIGVRVENVRPLITAGCAHFDGELDRSRPGALHSIDATQGDENG